METTIITLHNTFVGNDNNQQQYMTSLEIAELTGKQHKNVMQPSEIWSQRGKKYEG